MQAQKSPVQDRATQEGVKQLNSNQNVSQMDAEVNFKTGDIAAYILDKYAAIPEQMRCAQKWVVWRLENTGKAKPAKMPYQPMKPTSRASTTDPGHWGTIDQAVATVLKDESFTGVGFVFDGSGGCGVDLDNSFAEDGRLKHWAQCVYDDLSPESYVEYSPSGKGLHLITKATLPDGAWKKAFPVPEDHSQCVEVYDRARFFTVTGQPYGTAQQTLGNGQDAIDALQARYAKGQRSEPPQRAQERPQGGVRLDDAVVIDKASNAANGGKFRALMSGDLIEHGSDHSSADIALCSMLAFWCNGDAGQIDRIFRTSGLMREKWDSRRGASTYGADTIQRALEMNPASAPEPIVIVADSELRARAAKILKAAVPCGDFDSQYLPPVLHQYIREICQTTEAAPINVTASVLATVGAILKRRVYIPDGDYFQRLFPNLWLLVISSSGSFKTTALNKGGRIAMDMHNDISSKIRTLEHRRLAIQTNFDMEKEEQQAALEANKKEIASLERTTPMLPNRMTGEGLLEMLSYGYGGCIYLSEFGDWLETLDRNHNGGLKALFTDLYDVPTLYSYKTRTQGHLVVHRPFIAINAVSTLDWVKKNIKPSDVSSGFFARFLLFFPPQVDQTPPALPTYRVAEDRSTENELKRILAAVPDDHPLTISPTAAALFQDIHNHLYLEIGKLDEAPRGILNAYVKRWSPYLLKLAMINQAILDPSSKAISPDALTGALSVLEYAIKSTTHLFQSELADSEQQRKCRVVLEFIAKRGGAARRQEILASKTLEGGHLEYDYALATLIEQGALALDQSGEKKNWRYLLAGGV